MIKKKQSYKNLLVGLHHEKEMLLNQLEAFFSFLGPLVSLLRFA